MPDLVTPLKIVHILAAVVALGTNVTYGFWLRWAARDRDRLRFALDGIQRLDRTFANPAYLVLLVTGSARRPNAIRPAPPTRRLSGGARSWAR